MPLHTPPAPAPAGHLPAPVIDISEIHGLLCLPVPAAGEELFGSSGHYSVPFLISVPLAFDQSRVTDNTSPAKTVTDL